MCKFNVACVCELKGWLVTLAVWSPEDGGYQSVANRYELLENNCTVKVVSSEADLFIQFCKYGVLYFSWPTGELNLFLQLRHCLHSVG